MCIYRSEIKGKLSTQLTPIRVSVLCCRACKRVSEAQVPTQAATTIRCALAPALAIVGTLRHCDSVRLFFLCVRTASCNVHKLMSLLVSAVMLIVVSLFVLFPVCLCVVAVFAHPCSCSLICSRVSLSCLFVCLFVCFCCWRYPFLCLHTLRFFIAMLMRCVICFSVSCNCDIVLQRVTFLLVWSLVCWSRCTLSSLLFVVVELRVGFRVVNKNVESEQLIGSIRIMYSNHLHTSSNQGVWPNHPIKSGARNLQATQFNKSCNPAIFNSHHLVKAFWQISQASHLIKPSSQIIQIS